ncbi:telomere recombination-domain-containing protein [Aspergillus coremiiformis]|uniref:Ribosome quality control complex subunit 2 n=1 Tax=Aspergillus coremiiformis TaxID=138285 RepID=A0A5N6Z2M6_9EURO|nr:telomere recombination-domain-containing protein [Aspergillus coremiiformis]
MKQRFSSLDVKVISQELASEIVNLRVSNIYDLSSRIFLFKLAKPDHRKQLIVDSGFRCHVTQYSRATATMPSAFVTRMRKFLKSRRITSVKQIGTDRVIDFSFSDGMYHMFLEFFAGGNIIITDREYNILALVRQVSVSEGEEARVGIKYTVTDKQNYHGIPEITLGRIKETLEKAKALFAHEDGAPKKSKKKKNADVLRKALSQGFPEYPPLLLDHAFAVKEVDPTTALDQVLQDDSLLQRVNEVLEEAQNEDRKLSTEESHPGYIIAKEDNRKPASVNETALETGNLLYEDFHPFKPRQFEGKSDIKILEFPSLNATIDEYFSSIETQKLESRLTEREEAAKRKLDAVRQEHEKKIGALKEQQELHIRKAGAIEDNVYRVQEAMDAVNGLIAQGMDWVEIARLIEMEQSRGNPVARIIKLPLKLYENTITLLLGEAGDEQDEGDELFSSDESEESEDEEENNGNQQTPTVLTIDIDLGLSPWANAKQYYEQKKQAAVKEQRTAQSSTKALKSHEKKVTEDLKRGLKQEKQVLRQTRQPFWFEKFLFFISSEGYLVLGGRDAMQSEMLYRRHLKKGDIFVHADLEGAKPMIVKNRSKDPNAPIPPSTLSQAGNLCVATSSAWDSKAVMSAWWAQASQISKTAEVGGLLPTGEFLVKGEKNFLAPSQLVLGFGVMFQISKDSLKNHKTHLFDEPEAPESTTEGIHNPAEESTQRSEEQPETIGLPELSEDPKGQVDEQSSESEDEPENTDSLPPRNPLQGGLSEPLPTEDAWGETKASGSDGENTPNKPEQQEGPSDEEDVEAAPADEQVEEGEKGPVEESASLGEHERTLSAREKRSLRKGKSPEPGQQPPGKNSASATKGAAAKGTNPISARGKKGKAKKAAAKYADQDEEDRELALRLLGANKGKAGKAAAAAEAKVNREKEAEAQKKRRQAQHERATEAERRRQALFEEGGDDYDEATAAVEAADLEWIPALIGAPRPEDEILAAIPVCAPWAALGRYRYKVKLQPGTVKKGKAVKEILGRWVAETTTGKAKKEYAEEAGISLADAEKLRAREGDTIKAWKDTEIINNVPVGKVRIMLGAGGGDSKGKGKGGGGGGAKLVSFVPRLVAGGCPRSFMRFLSTTTTMSPKEKTRIVSVRRLNKEGPGNKSLSEWWESERRHKTPEAAAIEEAAQLLRTNNIPVAFPTETVYGLGADATRSDAVRGIYKAKQRPSDNPLIVHIDSLEMLERLLNPPESSATRRSESPRNTMPAVYQSLIARFWPGPLTILLPNPSGSLLANEVTSKLTTFGARMPSSPLARLLIHVADRPLAAPSANASTKPSPTAAEHVYHDLQGRIELILDGGSCGVGVESTVVDGLCHPPAILRPGGIGIEEIRTCAGWENVQLGYHDGTLDVKEIPRAPGMKYRHYSPKARVVLFEAGSKEQSVAKHIRKDLEDTAIGAHMIGIVRTKNWRRCLGLLSEEEIERTLKPLPSLVDGFVGFSVPVKGHPSRSPAFKEAFDCYLGPDVESVARGLFAALRAMDEMEVDVIYVEGIPDQEGDRAAAVMNRLRKAAGAELRV